MSVVVWAVDPDLQRRGQLDVDSCQARPRDSDVGAWTMDVALDDVGRKIGDMWRVIIQDDDYSVMSGPILSRGARKPANTLTLSGVSDLCWMDFRITYPSPSRSAQQQSLVSHRKISGNASAVLQTLVRENAADLALPSRQVPGLSTSNTISGTRIVQLSTRFKPLLEECRKLARLAGIRFDAIQQDSGGPILWKVYKPADRTKAVRFNDLDGSLKEGIWTINAPTLTAAIVAGQEEGVDRTIREYTRPAWWRIEEFFDQRQTDDLDELEQRGTEALNDGMEGASAQITVEDTPTMRLFEDFDIGDTVAAEFGDTTITGPVRGADITWDGFDRTVSLKIGDHDTDDDQDPAWVKHVKALYERIRVQEVR